MRIAKGAWTSVGALRPGMTIPENLPKEEYELLVKGGTIVDEDDPATADREIKERVEVERNNQLTVDRMNARRQKEIDNALGSRGVSQSDEGSSALRMDPANNPAARMDARNVQDRTLTPVFDPMTGTAPAGSTGEGEGGEDEPSGRSGGRKSRKPASGSETGGDGGSGGDGGA
jgi:hypothetical protein